MWNNGHRLPRTRGVISDSIPPAPLALDCLAVLRPISSPTSATTRAPAPEQDIPTVCFDGFAPHQSRAFLSKKGLCGCGSKRGTQHGTLVSGNMDQNRWSSGGLILTHTHMALMALMTLIALMTLVPRFCL